MANFDKLKGAVANVIKANGRQEITGDIMQSVLLSMIGALGTKAQFAGVAVPGTNPGAPDGNVFYIATEKGVYANFGGITLDGGKLAVLVYDGTWKKQEVDTAGVFRDWLSQFGSNARFVGEVSSDVKFGVDAKADKVEIVAPTLNLIAPDDDPYNVTAATLPGATAQAAGVMTAAQFKDLGNALAKVGFAGNIKFNDPDFYQDVDMAQGWYTLPEGLYSVEGEAFSGLMLIAKSATAHQDDGRNVIIDSKPSFFFVGNAKFVTYDKDDTDIIKEVAKGDGFSVYTKMDATNEIQMAEFSTAYAISRFDTIEDTKELADKLAIAIVKILTNPIVTKVGKVIPSASDVSFDVTTADANVGVDEDVKTTTEKMTIPSATTEKAGVMSAKDKDTLDTLTSQGTLHDLFLSVGATYNQGTKMYQINGLDLTFNEMLKCYISTYPVFFTENWYSICQLAGIKTNVNPPGIVGWRKNIDGMYAFANNPNLIVLSFERFSNNYKITPLTIRGWFLKDKSLETIKGIDLTKLTNKISTLEAFNKCKSLKNIEFANLQIDINFSDSPLLSKDSILFLITKAKPEKPITVTLHPTAYVMATADAEIQAALEAQPLVSLAEGVPTV